MERRATPGSSRKQTASVGLAQTVRRERKTTKPSERVVTLGVVRACLWLDAEQPSDFAFCCGAKALPGKSYCATHQARVHVKGKE